MKAPEGGRDPRGRADDLLDRVLDLAPGARQPALDEWCAGNGELHAEVLRLLGLVELSASWLEPGALSDGLRQQAIEALEQAARVQEDLIGQRIGRWRILEEVGRGGMGTVYLVERADGQFEQRAALKLVRAGHGLIGTSRRFETERQILASLDHAGIARLLDGGQTSDGRPFFVMEHVAGRTVDRYADEERLNIDDRLDLFVRLSSGILHAHQRLVVHRDIKPSNIIVTRDGEVKLLDFGIARLLSSEDEHPAETGRPGSRILTPDYASPEDVRGDASTTASDIYQLGLLLYELLAGHRAQRVGRLAADALEEAVCRMPVVPPSMRVAQEGTAAIAAARRTSTRALARRLRGDLDAIVLRALRKEPARRYESVGELIADVQRHRRRLPVQAVGNGLLYRTGRFVRRHRTSLAWAAAILLASAWFLPQLGEQRMRAAREAERAELVERILGGVFTLPAAGTARNPPSARDYLDHAVTLVRRDMANQPVSQARLLDRLGTVYSVLGLYGPAIEVLQQSLAIHQATSGGDSIEAASTLGLLGQSQHFLGRYEEAERSVRAALDIRRMRFGDDDQSVVFTSLDLADLLHTRGALADAEDVLREAIAFLSQWPDVPHALARATRDLANVLRDRGQIDEADVLYRQALRMFTDLNGSTDLDVAATELYFARLLIRTGDLDEAERLLTAGLSAIRTIFGGEHPLTGIGLRNLGYLRIAQGRYDQAGQILNQSLSILDEWLGAAHSMVPRTRAHQADLAGRRGRPSKAAALAEQTLAEFARLGLMAHPSAIDACLTLGEALIRLERREEAAGRLAACAAQAERLYVPDDPRTVRLRQALQRAHPQFTSR